MFRDDTVLRSDVFLIRFCREIGESDVKIADVFNAELWEIWCRGVFPWSFASWAASEIAENDSPDGKARHGSLSAASL